MPTQYKHPTTPHTTTTTHQVHFYPPFPLYILSDSKYCFVFFQTLNTITIFYYFLFHYCGYLAYSAHIYIYFYSRLSWYMLTDPAKSTHMARVKSTLRLTSSKSARAEQQDNSSTPSTSSSRSKWCLALGMDLLSLTTPTATTTPEEPIAIRDFPPGCQPLPSAHPQAPHEEQSTETHHSRRRRRLLCDQEDSANSMGDGNPLASSASGNEQDQSSYQSFPLGQDSMLESDPALSMQHGTVCKTATGTTNITPAPPSITYNTAPPLNTLAGQSAPPCTSPPRQGESAQQQHNTTPVTETNLSSFSLLLWLSFSVHEQLNIHRGLPEYSTYGAAQLTTSVMPDAKQYEYHTCRHSFPHLPQLLYPSLRPDGIPGQYLHLTQIPSGCLVDDVTGLSPTYQVVIRFDHGYQGMKKQEIQEAALSRLETMGIPVATRFREPIFAIVNKDTKTWLGLLRIDLLYPERDELHLLKGERIFTLQLQNSEYVIGKVEKGFDFTSAPFNRRLKLKSEALSNYTSRQLLGELTQLGYIVGTNLKFVGIAKRTKEQDTAEVTLASDISKQYLMTHPMNLGGHKVVITTPSNDIFTNPNSPTALTTTIIVKGLPLNIMQVQITAAIHRLLGPKNVIAVSFDSAQEDALGRHDSTAIIRCLNAVVYTHWCNRKAVPLRGLLACEHRVASGERRAWIGERGV